MKRRTLLSTGLIFLSTLFLLVSCMTPGWDVSKNRGTGAALREAPIVIGYSNWPGWWPWAIAEQEGLFAANGVNVEMRWFDSYGESMEAFAAGELDGNTQTLNDTIAFATQAVNGATAVLVNDNSAGNDKIIVAEGINSIQDLKGKTVAIEEGVVDDFLLTLALKDAGMNRSDIEILPLETGAAADAFAAGQADAVGAFPPYWLKALERDGSKTLLTSADYPGAIPDLLVVSQTLVDQYPEEVQAIVKTWFETLEFMAKNPEKSDAMMAERANISVTELQQLKGGTKMFTPEDNLKAFSEGEGMVYLSFAAKRMADFMVNVGFMPEVPPLEGLLDDQFVKAYIANQ